MVNSELGALPPITIIRIEYRFFGPRVTFMKRRIAPGGKPVACDFKAVFDEANFKQRDLGFEWQQLRAALPVQALGAVGGGNLQRLLEKQGPL